MDIKTLLSERFNLVDETESGWHKIHCPFHKDDNPSAGINFNYNSFNCFSCNAKMRLEKFVKAIDGVEIVSNNLNASHRSNPRTKSKVHKTMAGQVQEMVEFLESKRLSLETITDNRGVYCDDFTSEYYGYLVFTLPDKTTTARKILKSVEGVRFLNSKGDRTLLGLENIRPNKVLILTEGITDYLSLYEMGYRNIVSSMGAKLSKAQAYHLRGKTVFILYDRDFPGYEGAKAAFTLLKEYKANPIIIELPEQFVEGIKKADVSSAYLMDRDGLKEWLDATVGKYQTDDKNYIRQWRNRPSLIHYPTGISLFDDAFKGGFTQGVYGVSGETSVGKSSIVIPFARSFVQHKARVLYETYELTIDQVWARYASGFSKYNWRDLEADPSLIEDKVLAQLESDSNYLKVATDNTLEEIYERAKYFDIIIIDYLQRMPSTEKDPNTAARMNNKVLSELAKEEKKTVILLSSMARSEYGSEGKVGIFKGSGDTEYTMAGGFRLAKVGDRRVHVEFVKNTRGKASVRGFLEMDWEHQLINEPEDL